MIASLCINCNHESAQSLDNPFCFFCEVRFLPSNLCCSFCMVKAPVYTCSCEFPLPFLCVQCIDYHRAKTPEKAHKLHPRSVYAVVRSDEELFLFNSRCASIEYMQKQLTEKTGNCIARARQEVVDYANRLKDRIDLYTQEVVTQLDTNSDTLGKIVARLSLLRFGDVIEPQNTFEYVGMNNLLVTSTDIKYSCFEYQITEEDIGSFLQFFKCDMTVPEVKEANDSTRQADINGDVSKDKILLIPSKLHDDEFEDSTRRPMQEIDSSQSQCEQKVMCVLCGKPCVSAKEGQDICLVCVNTRVNYPPCCICSQPIREKFIIMNEPFGELMALVDACCSYGCFLSLKQILNTEKCANCSEPVVPAKQVMLRCDHKFHNKDCLFAFMLKCNPRFADLNKAYQCPICKRTISFENEIKTAFAEGELEERMDKERIFMCTQCSSLEVVCILSDELMYCGNCYEHQRNTRRVRVIYE